MAHIASTSGAPKPARSAEAHVHGLPQELFDKIADELDREGVKALRLVNKSYANKIRDRFHRTHDEKIYVLLSSKSSLENFRRLAGIQQYARHIKTVVILLGRLPPDNYGTPRPAAAEIMRFLSDNRKDVAKWRQLHDEQEELRGSGPYSGQDFGLLSSAFQRLHNLPGVSAIRSIVFEEACRITHEDPNLALTFPLSMLRIASEYSDFEQYGLQCIDPSSARAFQLVCEAVYRARLRPTALRYDAEMCALPAVRRWNIPFGLKNFLQELKISIWDNGGGFYASIIDLFAPGHTLRTMNITILPRNDAISPATGEKLYPERARGHKLLERLLQSSAGLHVNMFEMRIQEDRWLGCDWPDLARFVQRRVRHLRTLRLEGIRVYENGHRMSENRAGRKLEFKVSDVRVNYRSWL